MYNSQLFIRKLAGAGYLLIAIIALSAFVPAQAECIDDIINEGETILLIDATNGCANAVGQVGCTIDFNKGQTFCEYKEQGQVVFRVDASITDGMDPNDPDPSGKTVWSTSGPQAAVDTVIVAGGTQGNNCGYNYQYDVTSGQGGFLKGASFQNTNSASFCSDLSLDEEPVIPPTPVAFTPPVCSDPYTQLPPGSNPLVQLDQVRAFCGQDAEGNIEPSLVCNFQLEKENAGAKIGEYCCICGVDPAELQTCVQGLDSNNDGISDCDEAIGVDGRKNVHIPGGEVLEFLETPGCVYSRARNTWIC